MRRLITVFERKTYTYSELGIEPKGELLDGIDKLNLRNNSEYLTLGRATLRTNQFVGVLTVGETTLQILPKIDCDPLGRVDSQVGSNANARAASSAGRNFIYMLALVEDLRLHPTTLATLENAKGQWFKQVIDVPGVRSRFNHYVVAGLDMFLQPGFQIFVLNANRFQDDLAVKVNPGNNAVVFVNIQG